MAIKSIRPPWKTLIEGWWAHAQGCSGIELGATSGSCRVLPWPSDRHPAIPTYKEGGAPRSCGSGQQGSILANVTVHLDPASQGEIDAHADLAHHDDRRRRV